MQLLNILFGIIRLRAGPQDLPASGNLLAMAIAASAVVSVLVLSGAEPFGELVLQILVTAVFALLFVWTALQMRGGVNRFLQTTTALFGTDALLTVIAMPAIAALTPDTGEPSTLFLLWLLLVLLWTVAVVGHIFRHALDLPFAGGVLVSLLYLFLSFNLTAAVT